MVHGHPALRSDFGRAVSRILSARPKAGERIICLSSQYPEPVPRCGTWSGPLQGPLFGLAPDGVFRASRLTPGAVGSYPTFSPLPPCELKLALAPARKAVCFLWHCPLGCLAASPPACILQQRLVATVSGYAASRPLVFGLSSPGMRRERSSALPKSAQIYSTRRGQATRQRRDVYSLSARSMSRV